MCKVKRDCLFLPSCVSLFEKEKNAEWKKIKLEIEKEFDKKAIKIGDQAVIDTDVRPNIDVPGPFTKKKGGDVVVAGGGGGNQQQSSGGGGGGGSSSTPKFSSEDSNNLSTLATSTTYNMVGV